jgi:hypothetical protein
VPTASRNVRVREQWKTYDRTEFLLSLTHTGSRAF